MLGHPGYGPSQSPIFSTMLENGKGRRLSISIKRKRRNRNTPDWAWLNSDNRLE